MVDEISFDADWFRENQLGLLCESMSQCLSDLLQNKLLYQHCSVKIQSANLEKREENAMNNVLAEFEQEPIFCTTQDNSSVVGAPTLLNRVVVPMTVCTDCETCHGETTPHNPIRIAAAGTPNREGGDQTYFVVLPVPKVQTRAVGISGSAKRAQVATSREKSGSRALHSRFVPESARSVFPRCGNGIADGQPSCSRLPVARGA